MRFWVAEVKNFQEQWNIWKGTPVFPDWIECSKFKVVLIIIQTTFDITLLQLQDYNLICLMVKLMWMEFTQSWMLFTICPHSEQTGLPIQMAIKLNFPFSSSTPSVPISNFHFFTLNLPGFTYFCSIGESLFSKFCILTPSAKRSFSFAFPVNKNKANIRTMSLCMKA